MDIRRLFAALNIAKVASMFRFAVVGLLQLAVAVLASANEAPVLSGSVTKISSDTWTITGFDSSFELSDSALRGEVRADRFELSGAGHVIRDLRAQCESLTLTTHSIRCAKATFAATIPGIGRQTTPGAFAYNRNTGTTTVELSAVTIAGARVRVDATVGDAGVDVRYAGARLQLTELLQLAATYSDAFAGYSAAGLTDVVGTFGMSPGKPPRIVLAADLSNASLANDAGTIATDGVAGKLHLDITVEPDLTRMTIAFDSKQGEAYLEPVYANFSQNAVRLTAENVVTPDFSMFTIPQFRLLQEALLDVGGSATLQFGSDETQALRVTADVAFVNSSIANLYDNLLKIHAAGTVLGDLETAGQLSGSVSIADNQLRSAAVNVADAIFDDRRGRFAVYGVDGAVDWNADESQPTGVSALRWDSGTAYKVIVGGGAASLQLGNDDVELLSPLRLPMLGGALLINEFVLNDFGSATETGRLDAELEPVQLGQLSGAFGWPAFSGQLSGRLPLLQLAEDTITVGGTLSARAFDGTIDVARLRIEQPFGRVPRLQADLAIRDLDLERVTEAFSFGLIQGRLSGDVAGLMLQSWRPVAMDMSFYTPANDKSQHRISQRAVENLASVGGGGAAAVLSTGFLKFFDVFAYDRIGLRCVLKEGVCAMSGVGPAKSGPGGDGYYIVKGRGVPRIDVVGFRDTVSWPRLVKQLGAITRSGPLTVN